MHLFIDTNIFLNFFHYAKDDLAELDKLAVLLRNQKITLHLPSQVVDEFGRNRDIKIADALKTFRQVSLPKAFPQIVHQYQQYKELRDALRQYEKARTEILEAIEADIVQERLRADQVIKELFFRATAEQSSAPEILEKARLRYDLGNPPGKNGSLGDAINWETLIHYVPDSEDLHLITADSDYISAINEQYMNSFLLKEWLRRKQSRIFMYKNLTSFFAEKFPEIKLSSEYELNLIIEALAASRSFHNTHMVLYRLSTFTGFSQAQLNDIVSAAVSNSQIYWIASDEDVNEILNAIVAPNRHLIDARLLAQFDALFQAESQNVV